jgi:DNA-binding winged helix-turn-helix (wHTH) protein
VGHNVLFLFNNYVLDGQCRELRKGDVPVALEPQVFDLLVYLIENRDRVVSKDDLIASVWAGRIVSESTLTSRINAVRRAIGDTGEKQSCICTNGIVSRRWESIDKSFRHD